MSYDKATVQVRVEHEGVVADVRELVSELNEPEKFLVRVIDESYVTEGGGVDGSKEMVIEVHEYVGEIPLFTAKLTENISAAEIKDSEYERGESELGD